MSKYRLFFILSLLNFSSLVFAKDAIWREKFFNEITFDKAASQLKKNPKWLSNEFAAGLMTAINEHPTKYRFQYDVLAEVAKENLTPENLKAIFGQILQKESQDLRVLIGIADSRLDEIFKTRSAARQIAIVEQMLKFEDPFDRAFFSWMNRSTVDLGDTWLSIFRNPSAHPSAHYAFKKMDPELTMKFIQRHSVVLESDITKEWLHGYFDNQSTRIDAKFFKWIKAHPALMKHQAIRDEIAAIYEAAPSSILKLDELLSLARPLLKPDEIDATFLRSDDSMHKAKLRAATLRVLAHNFYDFFEIHRDWPNDKTLFDSLMSDPKVVELLAEELFRQNLHKDIGSRADPIGKYLLRLLLSKKTELPDAHPLMKGLQEGRVSFVRIKYLLDLIPHDILDFIKRNPNFVDVEEIKKLLKKRDWKRKQEFCKAFADLK